MSVRDIIYVKKCLGKDKKPIDIYKIRTMDLDADQRLDELLDGFDSHGHPLSDPRITSVGRFLRKYWVDEIPQLYNLAKGDIKLVGIRPNSEEDWQKYPEALMNRALNQKPGLMGIQYVYSNTGDFENHIIQLEEYLDRWDVNPVQVDREYLSRIVWKIVFDGIRSS